MAGIVFPDVAGSVLPALQIQKSQQLMDLEAARQRKLDEEQTRQNSAGQYVPGALRGDEDAFNNLAKYNPDMAIKLRLYADQKKHAELQNAQEGAKALSQGAGAVLQAEPGDRPTAYQAYLTSLKSRGLDVSAMPPQYSPAVDSLLNFHFNSGVGADKLIDYHMKQPGVLPDGGGAPGAVPAPAGGGTGTQGAATASIESGGNYGAIGPVANKDGNRAYGKYQVMDFNIPAWTQEALGQSMTPQQFLANPQAQDAVYNVKMGQLRAKYGDIGAHKAWFAGETGMNNPNASDVNGMTVQRYGELAAKYGAGAGAGAPQTLPPPPGAMVDTNYAPPGGLPAVPPAGPPQPTGGPDLQAQAIAGLLPKAPVFGQGPQPYAGPQGDSTQVASGQSAPPPQTAPPPIQTLHQYVASVMPGAKLVGNLQTGEPLYNHDGYVAVQLPNGQRTFIPPPPKPEANRFEDVTDTNGQIIGQRNKTTNQYHPVQPVVGAGIAIDPNLKGDQVYTALTDQGAGPKANEVKGIVEGRLPLPSAQSRIPDAILTRKLAFQADPNLTDQLHAQRAKALTDLNSGKPNTAGYQLQAQGTLFNHIGEALDLNQQINNSPYPLVNKALNAVGMAQGDPRLAAIKVALGKVNIEGEKYFGGHTTVSGLAKAEEDLSATMGTPAFAGAVREYMKLVNGQQTQLLNRINRGMGYKPDDPRAFTQDNPEILTPDAKRSLDTILTTTTPNPANNSQLMDKGKQVFGAKPPPGSLPMPQTGAQGPRMSPEDAVKLPPGTPFIGLDGQPYVRH